jgi:tRNA threonylcarbamoyl adenosine modification protein (Sua5/YciO/YrdC/YwlC family)
VHGGAELDRAVEAIRTGGIVVYPTETVYGLGVDAGSPSALAHLLALKGRDARKGMSVLVSELAAARSLLAGEPGAAAHALARAFWPGPLTLVLPAAPAVDRTLVGPGGGVGLRCSTDPVARALLERSGVPLTSTSANPSGREPAHTIEEAREYFGAHVDAYVDGGARRDARVSTVVEFFEGRAYLRRAGAIALDALSAVTDVVSAVD